MRRTAIFALVCVLAVAVAAVALIYRARTLDAESSAFVASSVSTIATRWDARELQALATPAYRAKLIGQYGDPMRAASAQLGPPQQYLGATGNVKFMSLVLPGDSIVAIYVARERFLNGAVTLNFGLVRRAGHWMIDDFDFHAQIFDPLGPGMYGRPGLIYR